jgi:hypothetical protein
MDIFEDLLPHKDIEALGYINGINPLKPIRNYMYHLLYQSMTLHSVLRVLCDSTRKQGLFP